MKQIRAYFSSEKKNREQERHYKKEKSRYDRKKPRERTRAMRYPVSFP